MATSEACNRSVNFVTNKEMGSGVSTLPLASKESFPQTKERDSRSWINSSDEIEAPESDKDVDADGNDMNNDDDERGARVEGRDSKTTPFGMREHANMNVLRPSSVNVIATGGGITLGSPTINRAPLPNSLHPAVRPPPLRPQSSSTSQLPHSSLHSQIGAPHLMPNSESTSPRLNQTSNNNNHINSSSMTDESAKILCDWFVRAGLHPKVADAVSNSAINRGLHTPQRLLSEWQKNPNYLSTFECLSAYDIEDIENTSLFKAGKPRPLLPNSPSRASSSSSPSSSSYNILFENIGRLRASSSRNLSQLNQEQMLLLMETDFLNELVQHQVSIDSATNDVMRRNQGSTSAINGNGDDAELRQRRTIEETQREMLDMLEYAMQLSLGSQQNPFDMVNEASANIQQAHMRNYLRDMQSTRDAGMFRRGSDDFNDEEDFGEDDELDDGYGSGLDELLHNDYDEDLALQTAMALSAYEGYNEDDALAAWRRDISRFGGAGRGFSAGRKEYGRGRGGGGGRGRDRGGVNGRGIMSSSLSAERKSIVTQWDMELSSPLLDYSFDMTSALRHGSVGSQPAAMAPIPSKRCCFSVRLEEAPRRNNLFSFGLAAWSPDSGMVTGLLNGTERCFGKTSKSWGLWQQRNTLNPIEVWSDGRKCTLALNHQRTLHEGDVLSLGVDLSAGLANIRVNNHVWYTFSDLDKDVDYVCGVTVCNDHKVVIIGRDFPLPSAEEALVSLSDTLFSSSSDPPRSRSSILNENNGYPDIVSGTPALSAASTIRNSAALEATQSQQSSLRSSNLAMSRSTPSLSTRMQQYQQEQQQRQPGASSVSLGNDNRNSDSNSGPTPTPTPDTPHQNSSASVPTPADLILPQAARLQQQQLQLQQQQQQLQLQQQILRQEQQRLHDERVMKEAAARQSNSLTSISLTESSSKAKADSSVSANNDDTNVCCVCLDDPRSVVLFPCRHLCLCEKCSQFHKNMKTCPICRVEIAQMFRVFV